MLNRRQWVVLLAAVVTVGITARLGFWQLDRGAQKSALQAAVDRAPELVELQEQVAAGTIRFAVASDILLNRTPMDPHTDAVRPDR